MKAFKPLKPWHGIIVLALTALTIFFIAPLIAAVFNLGLSGTLVSEILLLIFALGVVLVFRGDFRVVFPLRKPKLTSVFGTLLFWLGSYILVMVLTALMLAIFPEQMSSTSESLNNYFASAPFMVSFFIVSISPAICEEAVFRGVFLNSIWGRMNKWVVILLTSLIFGIFHGSIWRLLPTMCLGIAMAYLLIETNNMFYNMLFHAVNNGVPVILLFVINAYGGMSTAASTEASGMAGALYISAFGLYLTFTGGGAFLVYIGNHLIHLGRPGYQNGLFPKEKRKTLAILIGITIGCMIIGGLIFMLALLLNPDFINETMRNAQDIRDIL
ncbi:MAG: CPBP family glutamic-type intramembrane protease [Lachnospiraceae bacterium]